MTDPIQPPVPNIPLLRKAVEWATAEAEKPYGEREWRQAFWAFETECGTSYCIAGYCVMAAHPSFSTVKQSSGDLDLVVDGSRVRWSDEAQQLLGLSRAEAMNLFDAGNTIEDVREVAEQIAGRAGERL